MTSIESTTIRTLADDYVAAAAALSPDLAVSLGLHPEDESTPDLSPGGFDRIAELQRETLHRLQSSLRESGELPPVERNCARVLEDHLRTSLERYDAGDHFRDLSNMFSPITAVQMMFAQMSKETPEQWAQLARRMSKVGESYRGYIATLKEGIARGLLVAPRQIDTVITQLDEVLSGRAWHQLVAAGVETTSGEHATALTIAADLAHESTEEIREYLAGTYRPVCEGVEDAVGAERYRRSVAYWTGARPDLHDAYEWGWTEYRALHGEMTELADRILPGATPSEALAHLDQEGRHIEGVEEVLEWLQGVMDTAISELDGTQFTIDGPVRNVEARIAPPGSAAAPYYTAPSLDFARPGRTWLPTLGAARFPVYDLLSTWYHEGVPGHHLQLARWVAEADTLSQFQRSVGGTSGNIEGWALYAETLMDELGYFDDETRMGYLDAQMMRAVRVVIDIGMHLKLDIPKDCEFAPGQTWTPALAEEFFNANSGRPAGFVTSEITRYLGMPGQAISYKLGQRVWLEGREAARQAAEARGETFDLKAWHDAALSQGALGLDDLAELLPKLP